MIGGQKITVGSVIGAAVIMLLALYASIKAYKDGYDCNVYLQASVQFFAGENIYESDQFYKYLYSPLFAALLWPLSLFDFGVGRVLWALINLALCFRLWTLMRAFLLGPQLEKETPELSKSSHLAWKIGTIFIAVGFINHNIILGQITIAILWLFLEGLHQIQGKKNLWKGGALLALGINIKIIPIIGLYYLFLKGEFRAIGTTLVCLLATLLLPALFVGFGHNLTLHQEWGEMINPSKGKYVFEDNNGTQSLNAVLPAFFLDFKENTAGPFGLSRQLIALDQQTLLLVLQSVRVALALLLLLFVFHPGASRVREHWQRWWEVAFICLITALIFPHQQKYAMLYFVPAGSYVILYVISLFRCKTVGFAEYLVAVPAILLMFLAAIMGRDIIGATAVTTLDYFHFLGLNNLAFVILLLLIPPWRIQNSFEVQPANPG